MKKQFLNDEKATNYLNENIGRIKRFEIIDDYYLRIHLNDGSYVEVEPEYGAIYFNLHQK